ncbi:hypothetical protein [Paenibacillus senegalimassiliensis]|uniref:hypothetical protein n=1 Tax=Paenibacillus senegalimassiliensis TaxID=1737426 RepID=UPI00073ED567|nr:hypothetical protein [Paenibacillus senegalimassiliensis]
MSTGDADKFGKGQKAKKMESAQQLKELQSAILVDTDGLKVAAAVGHTVLIPVSPSVEQARRAVVERLQHEPDRIADLLEQGITALLPLLPEQGPWLLAEEKVGQGASHYAGLAEAQGAAQTKRAQDLGGQVAGDDVRAMTKREHEHESIPAAQQPGSREAARCAGRGDRPYAGRQPGHAAGRGTRRPAAHQAAVTRGFGLGWALPLTH